MEILLAESAGFCFGVKRAVDTVYEQLEKGYSPIYTYGPIIHNENVVEDLKSKGIAIIDENSNVAEIKKGTVIIRSHGVKKSVVDELAAEGFTIIDATCPFVKKIHNLVKTASENGDYIVIIGNHDHPEVQGIVGWIQEGADYSVINGALEAKMLRVEKGRKITIVSQTTFNFNKFNELVEIIDKKGYDSNAVNTICNATEVRQTEAFSISTKVDTMFVVGGKSSSNTQKLYEICRVNCPNTYYIQTAGDIGSDMLMDAEKIGITAGASTPNNIIEEVQVACQN